MELLSILFEIGIGQGLAGLGAGAAVIGAGIGVGRIGSSALKQWHVSQKLPVTCVQT